MNMLHYARMTYVLLIGGFYLLIQGAEWLVKGSTSLAKRLHVSDIVIGLTVVAFGTSLPELVVNVIGSISGNSGIVLGNVIGSNIANTFLILGTTAMIAPLIIKHQTVWREIPFSFLAALIAAVMVGDAVISGHDFSMIDRVDGIVLLCFFAVFLAYIFGNGKVEGHEREDYESGIPIWEMLGFIALGLLGLVLGGKLVVSSAVTIATIFGLSETVIGLTVIAIGTSLPELVTSIVAAYRKSIDIAIGNVVGSNIFNIFLVLGASAVIRPVPLGSVTLLDEIMLVGTGLFLFIGMFVGKRFQLDRWAGFVFVTIYVLYIALLLTRSA